MGISHSKKNKHRPKLESVMVNDRVRLISKSAFDEQQIQNFTKELRDDPQTFVLDNLLMGFMFFENYEREKAGMLHSLGTPMEKELNPPELLRDEKIECMIPDEIFENVNKNMRYQPLHGPNKNQVEPLVPRRLFVVNDNIEVLETRDINEYSVIDRQSYLTRMEESGNKGFVKLRYLETQPKPVTNPEACAVKESQPGPSSAPDDEIYEYSSIKDINTPKDLNIINCERRDTLPDSCFTTRTVSNISQNIESSSEEEEDEEDYEEDLEFKEEKVLFVAIPYISSCGFMAYFQNVVFPNSLGEALGFKMDNIKLAQSIPGKIFCNLIDEEIDEIYEEISLHPCIIVPAVRISWPELFAYEFPIRAERTTMIDKFNNHYVWPKPDWINEIRNLKCLLIPKGFINKKEENTDFDIEWEIAFPKAERYLDVRMSHAQMKIFLFLLAIFKAFIEPKTKQHGVLMDHIRTHMYWECESNPKDWPEHKLGVKIQDVIKKLNQRLASRVLPDFFIRKKNLFESIPNKYLNVAQKVFHEVLQSPLIHFISALRNLRYNSGNKFYPPFDFQSLLTILTSRNLMPNVPNSLPPNSYPRNRRRKQGVKLIRDKVIRHQYEVERSNREKFMKLKKIKEEQLEEKQNLTNRTGSIDSVDLDWECEENFDVMKQRVILNFFINHFIEVAKKCRKLSTKKQSLFYLKQASYLSTILNNTGLKEDALELLEIIKNEEENTNKISSRESYIIPKEPIDTAPSTPKRNSAQFSYDITQQVKNNNINLNNLHKAYNNTNSSASPPKSITKTKLQKRKVERDISGRKSVSFGVIERRLS